MFSKLGKYSDVGLLVMRIGVGAMMIVHGYPKLMGGLKNGQSWVELWRHSEYLTLQNSGDLWHPLLKG